MITISSSTTALSLPTINTVSPGATEIETYRNGKTEGFLTQLANLGVFERLGKPAEIAAVVAFLTSENAGWMTAQNVRVNGGTA